MLRLSDDVYAQHKSLRIPISGEAEFHSSNFNEALVRALRRTAVFTFLSSFSVFSIFSGVKRNTHPSYPFRRQTSHSLNLNTLSGLSLCISTLLLTFKGECQLFSYNFCNRGSFTVQARAHVPQHPSRSWTGINYDVSQASC